MLPPSPQPNFTFQRKGFTSHTTFTSKKKVFRKDLLENRIGHIKLHRHDPPLLILLRLQSESRKQRRNDEKLTVFAKVAARANAMSRIVEFELNKDSE
jgi:hypothetical protein